MQQTSSLGVVHSCDHEWGSECLSERMHTQGRSQGTPKGSFQRNYGGLGVPGGDHGSRVYMYMKKIGKAGGFRATQQNYKPVFDKFS